MPWDVQAHEGMEPVVFRALVKADPEILLRSDAKSASPTKIERTTF